MSYQGRENRKIAIYSRKSKFTGKGESVQNQIEMCRNFIFGKIPNVEDSDILIFEDEGFSGGNTNRPQLQKMISLIKGKQISTVVCYKLDRISRNVSDFTVMYNIFEEYRVTFFSATEDYNTSTPAGKAMLNMCSVFAQMERETIAERIRDNMLELAKTGRWLGGTTPTGYESKELVASVTIDGKERKAHKLNIIKKEAELIQTIYNKFIETNSLTKTETYLLQNHLKTKTEKPFTRFSIRSILRNPVYAIADQYTWSYFEQIGATVYSEPSAFDGKHGVMAYNKTEQKPGRTTEYRDYSEWIVAVGKHQGMIPGAEWVKVQNLLRQNASKSYHKPKSNVALLSGLLFCGSCGDFMRPKLSQRLNANGEKIYSYLCETKEKSRLKNCNMKNPNGNILDKAICEEIKKLSENNSAFLKQLREAQKSIQGNTSDCVQRLERFKKELAQNEKKIENLLSSLAATENTSVQKRITEQINALDKENEEIKRQIKELEIISQNQLISDIEFDLLRDRLSYFSESFDTMSVEEKRSTLRMLIDRIVWDGENIHLYLFGAQEESTGIVDFPDEKSEPNGVGCK